MVVDGLVNETISSTVMVIVPDHQFLQVKPSVDSRVLPVRTPPSTSRSVPDDDLRDLTTGPGEDVLDRRIRLREIVLIGCPFVVHCSNLRRRGLHSKSNDVRS